MLDKMGVLELALRARSVMELPLLSILTYHRVSDAVRAKLPIDSCAFDSDVIEATPAEFNEQVETLSRNFSLIDTTTLIEYFEKSRPLPPNPTIISFDDGYLDCHDEALPILKKHGAKASFFIPTHYITHRRIFWWDRITYMLRQTTRERIQISYPLHLSIDITTNRETASLIILRVVKDYYALDLERFLQEVQSATGVAWDHDLERSFADRLLMTWDHVHALREAGMDIQSHTATHRVLQTLTPAQLRHELRSSREELERRLKTSVRAVAYPVGHSIRPEPLIRDAVKDAGYAVGFSNGRSINLLSPSADPLDIQRIATASHASRSYFRASVTFPMFAFRTTGRKITG